MIFGGLQKLTLLDFPGHVSCIVFTKGCDFLCPFCHNAPLVTKPSDAEDISEEEILYFLKKRTGILDGVCITGGEPLLHPTLPDFIKKVKALGYKVKLDTNGSFPERLISLVDEGLVDYVAMDVKNSFEKYSITAGCDVDIDKIKESIDFLLTGKVEYEFRTTVTKELHTIQDIEKIAKNIQGADKYFIQNFVDSGNVIAGSLTPFDEKSLEITAHKASLYTKYAKFR